MKDNFNSYITSPLMDYWRELCVREGELRRYGRGEDFFSVGSVAPYVGYVKSGTLKYVVYGTDGAEHVVGLEFAGEFVADFPFSVRGVKARVSVIADTPCEIYCYPTRLLSMRARTDADLNFRIALTCEALFTTVYERYMSMYSKTPLERYNDLLSRHPNLFALFSLRDIASFLNITPTHLSRLRRNVLR